MGGDQDLLPAVGLPDGDEPVALVHPQRPDAVVPQVLQGVGGQALHRAVPRHHEQEPAVVLDGAGVDHGLDPLALLHLENVDDIGALGGLAGLGDLVALLPVDLAGVGEEEDIVVG